MKYTLCMGQKVIALLGLVAALAVAALPARAESLLSDAQAFQQRRWRLIAEAPAVSLHAYPLGWALHGEMGVEFLRFNVVMAQVTFREDAAQGGGVGYLYQHTFVPRILHGKLDLYPGSP